MSDLENTFDKAAGKVKETAGDVSGDKDLEAEGKVQNAEGKAKDVLENASEKIKGAAEDAAAGSRSGRSRRTHLAATRASEFTSHFPNKVAPGGPLRFDRACAC